MRHARPPEGTAVNARRRHWLAATLALPWMPARASSAVAAPVSLAVWSSTPSETAALDEVIAAFTHATGRPVRREVINDRYADVLKSRIAARHTPDVFYVEAMDVPVLIHAGVLEPLQVPPDDLADFHPRFLDALRGPDGLLYGLPKDYSTLALYIHRGALARAGFTPEDVPADLDGLLAFAARLQPRLPRGVGAMLIEKDLARHLSALEAYGEPVIAGDGSARFARSAGAHRYLQALVRGRAARYLYFSNEDLGIDSPVAVFGSGRAALMCEGNWVLSALRRDYADAEYLVRPMPTVQGRAHTMAFVVGLCVSRFSRNRAGGAEFARFMTGAGMAAWARRSGTLPTRRSVETQLGLSAQPALAAHTAGAAYATVWSRGIGLPIINSNFGSQVVAVLNGSLPVDRALERVDRVSNREIERQR